MDHSLSRQFAEHERNDASRFKEVRDEMAAIRENMKCLATKEDIAPILEIWRTAKSSRNGVIWIATTIIAVAGAIAAVKGLFKF
jgi:hypothetical protein